MKENLENTRRNKLTGTKWHYSYNSPYEQVDLQHFDDLAQEQQVCLSGRIVSIRNMGKICFIKISNINNIVQVIVDQATENQEQILSYIDIGDICSFDGQIGLSKTEEKSLMAHRIIPRRKALLPLPDKWKKLTDVDTIRRQRYLDLIISQSTRDRFHTRLKVIQLIRQFFFNQDYEEVETPILQSIASGAAAKPFVTKHNALDQELFLRIAPELFLKRLTIAGFPKIFEIAKCFRNEGIDSTHLQEFTMLEMYEAFCSYDKLRQIGCSLVLFLLHSLGITHVKDIPYFSYKEFLKENGLDLDTMKEYKDLVVLAKKHDMDVSPYPTYQILLDQLYKKLCVKKVKNPILVYDYPASPLAKKSDTDDRFAEQFQIIMDGCEIVKAYLEQNDPDIQKSEFDKQKKEMEQGNEEAVASDDEYIEALMYGLPPTGGLGLGIDRLVQIITNCDSIRDVVFFPNMKNK